MQDSDGLRATMRGNQRDMAGEVEGRQVREDTKPPATARRWYWLLLLPFLALLYPPLYSHLEPHIFGIPFFYWYQAVWLGITAAITTVVYRRTR